MLWHMRPTLAWQSLVFLLKMKTEKVQDLHASVFPCSSSKPIGWFSSVLISFGTTNLPLGHLLRDVLVTSVAHVVHCWQSGTCLHYYIISCNKCCRTFTQ